jgi:hypothetical protein
MFLNSEAAADYCIDIKLVGVGYSLCPAVPDTVTPPASIEPEH